jgi:hypothetical protein
MGGLRKEKLYYISANKFCKAISDYIINDPAK